MLPSRTYPDVMFPEPSAQSRSQAARAFGWIGSRVQDVHGARLGRVEGVVVDRQTGAPQWLLVSEGADRTKCVPLKGVVGGGGRVTLPFLKQVFRRAPASPPDGSLTPRQEQDLCRAYAVAPTRGARLSTWERRRSTALGVIDPSASAGYRWEPPARMEQEQTAEQEPERERPAPGAASSDGIPEALLARRRITSPA